MTAKAPTKRQTVKKKPYTKRKRVAENITEDFKTKRQIKLAAKLMAATPGSKEEAQILKRLGPLKK